MFLTCLRLSLFVRSLQKYAVCENHVFKPTPLGLGLVEGYDKLELQMSQPTLRAHMEVRNQTGMSSIQRNWTLSNLCLALAHASFVTWHSYACSASLV